MSLPEIWCFVQKAFISSMQKSIGRWGRIIALTCNSSRAYVWLTSRDEGNFTLCQWLSASCASVFLSVRSSFCLSVVLSVCIIDCFLLLVWSVIGFRYEKQSFSFRYQCLVMLINHNFFHFDITYELYSLTISKCHWVCIYIYPGNWYVWLTGLYSYSLLY